VDGVVLGLRGGEIEGEVIVAGLALANEPDGRKEEDQSEKSKDCQATFNEAASAASIIGDVRGCQGEGWGSGIGLVIGLCGQGRKSKAECQRHEGFAFKANDAGRDRAMLATLTGQRNADAGERHTKK